MNRNQQISSICQWIRVEMELRLEPLNRKFTWIRVHKLEPCSKQEEGWDDTRRIRDLGSWKEETRWNSIEVYMST